MISLSDPFLNSSKRPRSPLAGCATLAGCCFLAGWAPLLPGPSQAEPLPASAASILTEPVVFEERDGVLAFEAEHFARQTLAEVRAWHRTTATETPEVVPDGDPPHIAGASGGAYLEVLPDTRRSHGDKLIKGQNFSNEPGKLAVLTYDVFFNNPGRYRIWGRAYSTNTEDNGFHVGLDGQWPESGQRWQTVVKRKWHWESKQRTKEVHVGVPGRLWLDIDKPGGHTISVAMREDGIELDKLVFAKDFKYTPKGLGPAAQVHEGSTMPAELSYVEPGATPTQSGSAPLRKESKSRFPTHWGDPPRAQTRDLVRLPGGYGRGSSTLKRWIQENLDRDKGTAHVAILRAKSFPLDSEGAYLDNDRFAAINPDQAKTAKTAKTSASFPYPSGRYDVVLRAAGENDGVSRYEVAVNDEIVGKFSAPKASKVFEEGANYNATFENVAISLGDVISVTSAIGSDDGADHTRARWSALAFRASDKATQAKLAALSAAERGVVPVATAPSKPLPTRERVREPALAGPRYPSGDGSVVISGDLKEWHKVTLTLDGPYAHENDRAPNPFTDYAMVVQFTHESGSPDYHVPGYFAADGDAAESSAVSGVKWRAHLSPDRSGKWTYKVQMSAGPNVALGTAVKAKLLHAYTKSGEFTVAPSDKDKSGRDFRAHGRLQYVGQHHPRFAGSGRYFLKAGADAPETFLAYQDFDATEARNPGKAPLKTWKAHERDWKPGDPTWRNGKGKGMIGALNYLSGKGCNVFSFLPYNAGGDGDNVWPFATYGEKFQYDCSKLDQWGIVFDHATKLGLYLHFKLQETENDDNNRGHKDGQHRFVPAALDGGDLGEERKLYVRELIARFGHLLALNWNLGEENTQTTAQQKAMIDYLRQVDPYDHHVVVHTYPDQQDKVYNPLLGGQSQLTGISLQNSNVKDCHWQVVKWTEASAKAGKPWIVAFDEPGTAQFGMPSDPDYPGTPPNFDNPSVDQTRKQALWGTLLGGGVGVEYYFGYKLPQNDIVCEDWRSRDLSWDYCRHALTLFQDHDLPFWEMRNEDELVGNTEHDNSKYCFAKSGDVYLVYLPEGGTTDLDLTSVSASNAFTVQWYNPRKGGGLQAGSVSKINGGGKVSIGTPPDDKKDDWVAVIR